MFASYHFCLLLTFAVLLGNPVSADRQVCYTAQGPNPVLQLPTELGTVVHTATKLVIYNFEPADVVTPAAIVSTNVVLVTSSKTTTTSASTGNPTTTVTKTIHRTLTAKPSTITTTKYKTSTKTISSTSTHTIPTSSGFVPISSSLPGSQGKSAKRNYELPLPKRSVVKPARHATSVLCLSHQTVTITSTSTVLGSTSTSVLAASTTQIAVTSTITNAFTVWPQAKTTSTKTVTITQTTTIHPSAITTTKTVTRTSTTTDVIPGPTYYAACGPENLMPTYQNNTVDFLAGDNQPDSASYVSATDLYSCCVACFELPNGCAAGALDHINDPSSCELWFYSAPRPQNDPKHRMDTWGCNDGGSGAFNGYGGEVTDYIFLGGCD